MPSGLYSIQFLHQITTRGEVHIRTSLLYSIQFLHQITTLLLSGILVCCCIVSNFYIKSQLPPPIILPRPSCIVSNFYIKSQLDLLSRVKWIRCIVSNFYIKSQPQVLHLLIIRVLHPYVPRKSDVRRTEEVDSMQFFRSAKQIYQKNSSC